ncbi:putative DNA polymerase V/Myb-binding protein 1A [Septoria linicola]|nr:putative DNA polymerase V/Myb-binding protein 1A [Septoria linicola]
MAGTKRPFDEDESEQNVHPARKPRMGIKEQSADQKELNRILRKLGEEVSETRIEATKELLHYLAEDENDFKNRVDKAVTRLIIGVCSGARASRLGFSLALAEVLRFARDGKRNLLNFEEILSKIAALTPEGDRGGDERNHLLGRMYALHAILLSDVLRRATEAESSSVFDAISELALQKEWIRGECGLIVVEFLKTSANEDLVLPLIGSLDSKGLLKSPEGVAIWLAAKNRFEGVKLPKKVWHHRNPLSSQDRGELTRILLKNAIETKETETPQQSNDHKRKNKASGTRQSMPSFAWGIILQQLYEADDGKDLAQFWEDCVAKPMFSASSSAERKALGLQLFSQAVKTAPAELLGDIVHANIVRCIVDQRSKSDRTLFAAAVVPLKAIEARGKADASAAAEIVSKLLEVAPFNLDKATRQTIDTLLGASDPESLVHVVKVINDVCRSPGLLPTDAADAEKKRRQLADAQLSIIRSRRSQPEQFFKKGDKPAQWLKVALRNMTDLGFTGEKISPSLHDTTRAIFQDRLISALGHLVNLPIDQAVVAPLVVVERLRSAADILATKLDDSAAEAVAAAQDALEKAAKKAETKKGSKATVAKASQLLLALGILQVHKQEPDSIEVLKDITDHFQSSKSEDSSLLLVELLLSFVAKPSALFRKLAEQVFAAFASEVTADGLQSLISVLEPKESLAGKRELFKGEDEDDDEEQSGEESDDGSDVEMEDVEDASDIELVNGNISGAAADSDDEGSASDSSDEDATGGAGDKEEAEFDRKLADALGTAGMEDDSDDHGSDMDDDQMMALTPHLETIFKQRKKSSSNKQDNKEAKEDVVNLKNRVLDLLSIYVKSQSANPLALDLLLPLITLTRATTSQSTAQKGREVLETYFDTSKKQKALPTVDNVEDLYKVLGNVHDEVRLGGRKEHTKACSRSSVFLAKVLISHYPQEAWKKINQMYGELLDEWRKDAKTKIHGDVFSDWNNYSMQR